MQCRRKGLLAYFGEAHPGDCGHCDNCLHPPRAIDGTELGRKALSAVARTDQKFGAGHLIDILMGRHTDKVDRFGHDRLSVFGIGATESERTWSSVFRQLTATGFLDVDAEYGAFLLNRQSWQLMRAQTTLLLRQEDESVRAPRSRAARSERGTSAKSPRAQASAGRSDLFESLRALRKQLAEAQGIPPYVVFHDATLREMATQQPQTLESLAQILRGRQGQARALRRSVPARHQRPWKRRASRRRRRDAIGRDAATLRCRALQTQADHDAACAMRSALPAAQHHGIDRRTRALFAMQPRTQKPHGRAHRHAGQHEHIAIDRHDGHVLLAARKVSVAGLDLRVADHDVVVGTATEGG